MVCCPGLIISERMELDRKSFREGNKNEKEQQDAEVIHGAASMQEQLTRWEFPDWERDSGQMLMLDVCKIMGAMRCVDGKWILSVT